MILANLGINRISLAKLMTVMTVFRIVVILAHRPYHRPIFSSSFYIAEEQSLLAYIRY